MDDSLIADGWVRGRQYQILVDTGAAVTVIRPDVAEGLPSKKPNRPYQLVTASGDNLPVVKEALLELTLGRSTVRLWVFVARVAEEVILGLDALRSHDATVDVGRRILRLGRDEVTLRGPNEPPGICKVTLVGEVVVPARSEVVVRARLEGQRSRNLVLDRNTPLDGLCVARVLLPCREEVPVRLLNPSDRDQGLRAGTELGVCEPAVSVSACDGPVEPIPFQDLEPRLEDLLERAADHLTAAQLEKVRYLLGSYQSIFSQGDGDYGHTNRVLHHIDTGDAQPIRQPPRRVPLAKQAEVRDLLTDMRSRGIIEESDSPWCSPVVLVKKKNGELRFCVDYRKLNAMTRKDCFPLPRIDDTLDTLAGAQWFSTLDLKSGY